jgi:cyclophilin family peptidyl-prolyl cis-trans isomerase
MKTLQRTPAFPLACLVLLGSFTALLSPIEAAVREFAVMEISGEAVGAGTLKFELWPEAAPKTVANFRYLAESGFYDNTAFHRLSGASAGLRVLQGGDPLTRFTDFVNYYGMGNPGYRIPDERPTGSDYSHVRGVLSMANSGSPHSAGSQFFVMLNPFSGLDGGFASFGRTTDASDDFLSTLSNATTVSPPEGKYPPEQDPESFAKPETRITIDRVRIQREFTETDRPSIAPATYAGKLEAPVLRASLGQDPLDWLLKYRLIPIGNSPRPIAWSILRHAGAYSITVTRSGAVSGKFNYYGRTVKFRRQLFLQSDNTYGYSGILDPEVDAPIQAEIRLQPSGSDGPGILSLRLFSPPVQDQAAELLASGASTPPPIITLPPSGRRFTWILERPEAWYLSNSGESQTVPASYHPDNLGDTQTPKYWINGYGYVTATILKSSASFTGAGFLPDGRPFSFSRQISGEGCRSVVNLSVNEMHKAFFDNIGNPKKPVPADHWKIKAVSLGYLGIISSHNLYGAEYVSAELEIPTESFPLTTATKTWFFSFNSPIAGLGSPMYTGASGAAFQPWESPEKGRPILLFPDFTGTLKTLEKAYAFRITPNLRGASFPGKRDLKIRIDPALGVFSGETWISAGDFPSEYGVAQSLGSRPVYCRIRGAFANIQSNVGYGQLATPAGTFPIEITAGDPLPSPE